MMFPEQIGSFRSPTMGLASRMASLLNQKPGSAQASSEALAQQLGAKVETLSGPEGTTVSITHATFWQRCPCRVKGGEPQSNNRRRCCMLAPMSEMTFRRAKGGSYGKAS